MWLSSEQIIIQSVKTTYIYEEITSLHSLYSQKTVKSGTLLSLVALKPLGLYSVAIAFQKTQLPTNGTEIFQDLTFQLKNLFRNPTEAIKLSR